IEYGIAAWKGALRAQKSERIDIIEGTETGMLLLTLLWKRSPVIIRLHGEQYTFHKYTPEMRLTAGVRLSRVLQRIALRRADGLISPSEAHASEISKELGATQPLCVIPNCVDVPDQAKASKDRDESLVLFVGRLDRVKGVKVFLEAAALVVKGFPKARFVVAGTSHPTLPPEEIESIIGKHPLKDQVRLTGYVGPDELGDLYERSAVCVVPSYYESFGLAALEAMAHGLPVIAARAGGLPEIVEDGISGRLVPSGEAQAFASAIVEILSDDAKRTQMSVAARRRAQAHFSIERINRMNLNVFEELRSRSQVSRQFDERSSIVAPRAT
ncbi:MAG TPA: glycosyltransferase family 4 protein, partial [Pyrinomonadaceae bacterium]|nr:glycosyltransferase family 4 protein [Pyrinomonadaceae bacterium]